MLRILLKIWPAFLPILVYIFWIFVVEKIIAKFSRKKDVIEGEKIVGEKSTKQKKVGNFSLENRCFVTILYMSFILAILSLLVFAFAK